MEVASDRLRERNTNLRKFYFGDIFRDGIYKPLHSDLFDSSKVERWSRWLSPSFLEMKTALRSGQELPSLREEAPGVYSFVLFTDEFCDLLVQEVEHAQKHNRKDLERPNGMNRYGLVLNQLGLEPLITQLQQEYLGDLQANLYPVEGSATDDHHCFIVRYGADEDVGLDMHEDDSDVTLNVCLGKAFTAATLSFCGLASEDNHRKLQHTYVHQKGRAVIHLGRQRHGADNIESGERINFILWTTNTAYRASEAYNRDRMRRAQAMTPDPLCLSYTHDRDYTEYLEKPHDQEALSRGVMLDVVERRLAMYKRPVHDLCRPIEEINELPSVCLFIEALPASRIKELYLAYMQVAATVLQQRRTSLKGKADIIFFIAVESKGAVSQIRELCGLRHSPALAVLDVENECCYKQDMQLTLDHGSIQSFVESFLKGELKSLPLGSHGAEEDKEAVGRSDAQTLQVAGASKVPPAGRSRSDGEPASDQERSQDHETAQDVKRADCDVQ